MLITISSAWSNRNKNDRTFEVGEVGSFHSFPISSQSSTEDHHREERRIEEDLRVNQRKQTRFDISSQTRTNVPPDRNSFLSSRKKTPFNSKAGETDMGFRQTNDPSKVTQGRNTDTSFPISNVGRKTPIKYITLSQQNSQQSPLRSARRFKEDRNVNIKTLTAFVKKDNFNDNSRVESNQSPNGFNADSRNGTSNRDGIRGGSEAKSTEIRNFQPASTLDQAERRPSTNYQVTLNEGLRRSEITQADRKGLTKFYFI